MRSVKVIVFLDLALKIIKHFLLKSVQIKKNGKTLLRYKIKLEEETISNFISLTFEFVSVYLNSAL